VPTDTILYLSERDVARAVAAIDVIEAVASALSAHANGETVLPAEAYLGWEHAGEPLRSLSMPAVIEGSAGVKLINANPENPARGLPRASGLIALFDIATGRPACILEGAHISYLRTAAVTALAAHLLAARPVERLALLGAGTLARCHAKLLTQRLPELRDIRLYDIDASRAATLAADTDGAVVCSSAEETIRGAQLVVPVTTTTSGYIRHAWLEPGSLLVNVSLDDPLPEVVLHADTVFVDDWPLISADTRRLLGRMLRTGQIRGPNDAAPGSRTIDGELGDILIGKHEGRSRPDDIILVNPFGLAIEDIAVASRVHQQALRLGLGTALDR
jgi:ornithine cyclodeaminase/alanine dehydrogenase-like protein (mu-crystallin family)